MKEKLDPNQYTKYEKARILGARALQISANAPILLKMEEDTLKEMKYDPIKIAELEFEEGILPITVKRPLPKKVEKKGDEIKEIVKEEETIKSVKEEPVEEGAIKEEIAEAEAEEAEAEESEESIAEEIEKTEVEE